MALHKLFDTAPKFGADDFVGRLRSGTQIQGRPVALSEWRITTGDPEVAAAVAEKYGGSPAEWETKTEEVLEVLTNQVEMPVLLSGLQSEFVLWGRGNTPIRRCDGSVQKDDASTGCVCPSDIKEHKEGARAGSACQPSVRAIFRLADLPDLGMWRFNSASWQLAESINETEKALEEAGGEAPGVMKLELVEYTTKNGRNVSYTKPVIEVAQVAAAV
jgi:hypothetical protein